jgi:CheY-like chemotaxis protein
MLRGHEVHVREDAAEALTELVWHATVGAPFDLVLCDYCMPKVSGAEVRAAMRYLDECPMFVMMSGDPRELAGVACDATLAKPFRASDLLATIAGLVDARAHRRRVAITSPARP